MSAIIEVVNLTFGYAPARKVLDNVSFQINPGTFLAIAGPNGAGKSTLLNLLSATLKPDCGTIHIDGKAVGSYSTQNLAGKIAVVRGEFMPMFDFSVVEVVMMARTPHFNSLGFEAIPDREIVESALQATDTMQFASRPLRTLSNGERQRVLIARALAQDTPILLLDEPTSFLDFGHQIAIYDLLKATQIDKGKTIVAVTHDLNLAYQYCEQAFLLTSGPQTAESMDSKTKRLIKCQYYFGKINEVFTQDRIQQVFGTEVFTADTKRGRFFVPLGRLTKTTTQNLNTNPDP
jgi:iron complex transport system ATP-binding protein